jgi:hypothetical protein
VIDEDTNWIAELNPKMPSSDIFKAKKKLYKTIRTRIERLYWKTYNMAPYRIASHLAKTGWFSEALDKIRKKYKEPSQENQIKRAMNLNNDIYKITYTNYTNYKDDFIYELHIKAIIGFNLSVIPFFKENLKTIVQNRNNSKWKNLIESEEKIYNRIMNLNPKDENGEIFVPLLDGECFKDKNGNIRKITERNALNLTPLQLTDSIYLTHRRLNLLKENNQFIWSLLQNYKHIVSIADKIDAITVVARAEDWSQQTTISQLNKLFFSFQNNEEIREINIRIPNAYNSYFQSLFTEDKMQQISKAFEIEDDWNIEPTHNTHILKLSNQKYIAKDDFELPNTLKLNQYEGGIPSISFKPEKIIIPKETPQKWTKEEAKKRAEEYYNQRKRALTESKISNREQQNNAINNLKRRFNMEWTKK